MKKRWNRLLFRLQSCPLFRRKPPFSVRVRRHGKMAAEARLDRIKKEQNLRSFPISPKSSRGDHDR